MRPIIILIICLMSASIYAQKRNAVFASYFDTITAHHLYDGNIALAENGHKLYAYSGGYADYATQQKNTEAARFNLASISKIFTSTAILQLKDKRKLKLEDKVVKYLLSFPFPEITLHHLLTHTSGLPNLELYEDVIKEHPDSIITNAAVLPLLRQWKKGLYFTPGEQFRYCNTNYTLLAMIVEKITGIDFPAYAQKYIFKPAGMKETYIAAGDISDDLRVKQQIKPTFYDTIYLQADQVKRYRYSEYNNNASIGPSNVITTVDDMLKFDEAFFKGKLLSLATVEKAITPVKLNNGKEYTEHMDTMLGEGTGQYGLGWEIFQQPVFGKGVGHGGFKFGLATFYYRNLTRKQTIIAYTNGKSSFGDNVTSCLYMMNDQPFIPLHLKVSAVREYAKALMQQGADHAACMLHLYMADTTHYYFDAKEMNFLGYDFLYQSTAKEHKQWSLETFKINTFLHPDDFNTYDSYGEALLEDGHREDAIRMYRKSLELNPTSQDGIKAMKKLGLM
ncbi:beta-lactamase family protein [Chitinophaga pendula]|uniref:serine hydrolase domain-containing protein n=1 Tax=Chitinophaga TaxID=79328 RepID=UPI0012FE694B|nr:MULTISPECIES: serine hydrolase domain-containing protein [Chitinophaga]UCJ08311.1 beta-lactamase family protein [Chitinophaga pendula]